MGGRSSGNRGSAGAGAEVDSATGPCRAGAGGTGGKPIDGVGRVGGGIGARVGGGKGARVGEGIGHGEGAQGKNMTLGSY